MAPALSEDLSRDRSEEQKTPGVSSRRLLHSAREFLVSLIEIARWQLLTTVGLITLASLSEGLGVALLFPVLEIAGLNTTNQKHLGHYTAEIQRLLISSGLPQSLWLATLLMIFLLLMALRSLFGRAQTVRTFRTVLKYEMALSLRLYEDIINAEWLFLARRRSSDFTHALTSELARVASATYLFISFLASLTLSLVYVALALKLSAATTLMVLAAGAVLMLFSRRWMRAVHESGEALSRTVSAVYSAATEHLQSLKAIKAYDAQAANLEMFTALEKTALDQSLHSTRNQAAAAFWFEAGSLVVLGAVIFVSLRGLRVGAANILLLLAIFTRLMPRLASGSGQLQAFLADLPAFEAIGRISQECRENAEVSATSDPAASDPAPVLAHELRLEDVSFRYEQQLPWVLDRMSLTIAAGKITAIAGASGAGKSTIADVINGLLLPESGRVLVDGVAITQQAGRAWRRQVGYVAQDTMLFHDTVRANMLWARPGATEDDLREALTLAAAEFVFDLPRGLDTMAGDRGVLLSNGQRQRIALARALLRKPSLLILDEATNSLDMENEKRILDAIEQLKKRITIVLIAHRASAVRRAETIYVVENGRVVECGNWESLSSRPSTLAGSLFALPGVPVA